MFNFLTFKILISTREELLCFMVPSWPMSHPGLEQLTGGLILPALNHVGRAVLLLGGLFVP